MQPSHYLRVFILAGMFLLSATLASYWPVLDSVFVDFDDPLYVTENTMLQQGLNWRTVRWAFCSNHAYNWHPVTWLSLLVDFELYHLKPAGYHLTNLILHLANALLLLVVLTRMTRKMWASLFVAALFALHPLHVESVAWISERKDVLSAFFFMLTLWAYARYTDRPGCWRYLVTLALFAVGLMAKPMLVSLPLVLLLLDYWPLQRLRPLTRPPEPVEASGNSAGVSVRLVLLEKLPFALLSAIVCVVTFIVQRTTGAVGSFTQYPPGIRVANAVLAYQNYLKNMFWPTHLACLYPYNLDLQFWNVLSAVAVLLAVTLGVFLLWRRSGYLIAGWLWYLVTLVPVIGLVQVGNQAMADRYTYIPLIGVFIMIAWGLPDLVNRILPEAVRRMAGKVLCVMAFMLLALLGIATWFQAGTWRDTVTVFEHAVAVTENNYLAHNNLANALPGRGRLDDAIRHYAEALKIKPDYAEAHNNIGVALAQRGQLDEAIAHYREALRLRPGCAEVYVNLGTILYNRGNLDEAAVLFSQAIQINPFLANAHYNLGILLAQKGMLAEAVNHYVSALSIRPDMLAAYQNLITALVLYGEYGKAMIAFKAALHFYREWLPALNESFWLLATRRGLSAEDRADLIRMAEEIGQPGRSRDLAFLDALGVACAGADQFKEAIQATTRALDLAQATEQAGLTNAIGQRLALYANEQPYFEESAPVHSIPVPPP